MIIENYTGYALRLHTRFWRCEFCQEPAQANDPAAPCLRCRSLSYRNTTEPTRFTPGNNFSPKVSYSTSTSPMEDYSVVRKTPVAVTGLPPKKDGTIVLVSKEVAKACRYLRDYFDDRDDLYIPYNPDWYHEMDAVTFVALQPVLGG